MRFGTFARALMVPLEVDRIDPFALSFFGAFDFLEVFLMALCLAGSLRLDLEALETVELLLLGRPRLDLVARSDEEEGPLEATADESSKLSERSDNSGIPSSRSDSS